MNGSPLWTPGGGGGSGDITGVTAGTGVSGGGLTGAVTVNNEYVEGAYTAQTSQALSDNQTSAANITALLFSDSNQTSVFIDYEVSRSTDREIGMLGLFWDSIQWNIVELFKGGDDTGMTFSVTAAGQVQYTSTSTGNAPTIKTKSRGMAA